MSSRQTAEQLSAEHSATVSVQVAADSLQSLPGDPSRSLASSTAADSAVPVTSTEITPQNVNEGPAFQLNQVDESLIIGYSSLLDNKRGKVKYLYENTKLTYQQIGDLIGVSRERVRQILVAIGLWEKGKSWKRRHVDNCAANGCDKSKYRTDRFCLRHRYAFSVYGDPMHPVKPRYGRLLCKNPDCKSTGKPKYVDNKRRQGYCTKCAYKLVPEFKDYMRQVNRENNRRKEDPEYRKKQEEIQGVISDS